jgi:hypothetical protein
VVSQTMTGKPKRILKLFEKALKMSSDLLNRKFKFKSKKVKKKFIITTLISFSSFSLLQSKTSK